MSQYSVDYTTVLLHYHSELYNNNIQCTLIIPNTRLPETHRTLDLGAPLILGSLPQDFQYGGISFQPFSGCIRNVLVNDELIDFSETLAELNLGDGCRFADAQCDRNPCGNGGTCVGVWGGYYCDCVHAFAGTNCTKGISLIDDIICFFCSTSNLMYLK